MYSPEGKLYFSFFNTYWHIAINNFFLASKRSGNLSTVQTIEEKYEKIEGCEQSIETMNGT